MAMEAIGGTGDTLTGMLTVLCGAVFKPADAAVLAVSANRRSGHYADPSPAAQAIELIEKIPQALAKAKNDHRCKESRVRAREKSAARNHKKSQWEGNSWFKSLQRR